mgnify:FL=1
MSDLGNKEIFSKNLKYYMTINNKNRNDVCRDLDIPYTTFAEWYNANIYPRIDKIEMLANYFDIKKSDLVEDKDKLYEQLKNIGTMYISNTEMVKIPVLGVVKAGYDYLAQENWIGTIDVEKNIVNDGSEYFALKVVGDSMSPVLIQDDIVVIKKQNDFENGDIVVAIVNGNEATIKKGKKTDSSITLQPLNPSYDPLVFTYDEVKSIPVTIVGIVKQLKREF